MVVLVQKHQALGPRNRCLPDGVAVVLLVFAPALLRQHPAAVERQHGRVVPDIAGGTRHGLAKTATVSAKANLSVPSRCSLRTKTLELKRLRVK